MRSIKSPPHAPPPHARNGPCRSDSQSHRPDPCSCSMSTRSDSVASSKGDELHAPSSRPCESPSSSPLQASQRPPGRAALPLSPLPHSRPSNRLRPTAALHFGALLCHQNLVSGSSPFLFVPIRPVSETKKAGGLCSFLCPGDSAYRRLIFQNAWPQPSLPN